MTVPPSQPDRSAGPRTDLRFRKAQHLRKDAEFQRVYDEKQRASDPLLLVFGCWNGLGYTRIGLSVSRKHGNSVVRHRLKRLLREAFRLRQDRLPQGLDLVLIPRAGVEASVEALGDSLERLARKLSNRLQRENADKSPPASPASD